MAGPAQLVQVQHPDVDHGALLQGRPQSAMQAVLQVQLARPQHGVREQVAVERRVVVQQGVQSQLALGSDEFVEAHLVRRDARPVFRREPVIGVGATIPDVLEDHLLVRSSALTVSDGVLASSADYRSG